MATVKTSRSNATNNVSQRTNTIHEDPESRKGLRGLEDASFISTLPLLTADRYAHPLNIMVMENMRVATAPAVLESGSAAIIIWANVLAKVKI